MPLVPALCPQCGASIKVDNSKNACICEYCGTALITEKAINNYNITNNVNVNTSGNTINIFYNNSTSDISNQQNTESVAPYTITITRKKRFSGCAVIYRFIVDGSTYELPNGGKICFSSTMKHLDIEVVQVATFGGGEPFYGRLIGEANGNNIEICISIGKGFNVFSVDIISTTNKTIRIQ